MYNGYNPMNGMYNNYPYAVQQPNMQQMQPNRNMFPHYEIIKVNGKPGVDAFQMGPNSETLLLDETANIVWFVQTDGAGYKTATPFAISPYVEQPQVSMEELQQRLAALENSVSGIMEGMNNGKFDFRDDGEQAIARTAKSTAKSAATK